MASMPVDVPESVVPSSATAATVAGQDLSSAQNQHQNQAQKPSPSENETVTVQKIQGLLRAKDDTSRFVGLALLKSVLDNSPQLREDETAIAALWQSVSPKFLDRLLRSGSKRPSLGEDARDMIDIAVAVLHTFSALLPDNVKQDSTLVGRIPALVSVVLYCSNETIRLILQTLLTVVNSPEGANVFVGIDDVSPLIEMAPSQPLVLDVFLYAYAHASTSTEDKTSLRSRIDQTIRTLAVSFKGTDAVTLLTFVDQLLRRLGLEIIPQNPTWLKPVTDFVRNLVMNKPTPAGRAAYTNLSASLLQLYPAEASILLFSDDAKSDNPFSYLLINLALVDLRSSFPSLLAQLNQPEYDSTSRRLASAFDLISAFVGFLVRVLEDEDLSGPLSSLMMAPDLLLKLRKSLSETLSLTIEYLRDRWDASVAGAMGLHPDARGGTADTSHGAHYTLAWDSKTDAAAQDPLVLAAVRALAIWLREDDNDLLRREAAGLCDMLMDLYKGSASGRLDFRRPVLVALEGIVTVDEGAAAFLENEGWEVLTGDMLASLQAPADERDAARGIEIIRVLLSVVEGEEFGSREAWMGVVTAVAAWGVPDDAGKWQSPVVLEFQVAALQLVTALLANSHRGMQARYVHSTGAVLGIAAQLRERAEGDPGLSEALSDVVGTLSGCR